MLDSSHGVLKEKSGVIESIALLFELTGGNEQEILIQHSTE